MKTIALALKRVFNFVDKNRLAFVLVLLLLPMLAMGRDQLFTISPQLLDDASVQYQVQYEDQAHSFVIVPAAARSDTAIIFYPGALVDSRAYVPKLAALASNTQLKIFILKPYLRLAVLNPNAAQTIINANPTIHNWYISGHSMGGGAACNFSYHHPGEVQGLILLAAYCSPTDQKFSGQTLAVTGSQDRLESTAKVRSRTPNGTRVVEIAGANHASFGNYGRQPFDMPSTINETDMTTVVTQTLQDFIEAPQSRGQ